MSQEAYNRQEPKSTLQRMRGSKTWEMEGGKFRLLGVSAAPASKNCQLVSVERDSMPCTPSQRSQCPTDVAKRPLVRVVLISCARNQRVGEGDVHGVSCGFRVDCQNVPSLGCPRHLF